MSVRVIEGDCLQVLPTLESGSVDAVVCDPPYEIGFMGRSWDEAGVAFNPETWQAALRVLKPGGYMLAFGGTRTQHRMACAIEDAGFEIRDCLLWLYGTGFPKGQGCLKPAYEPIILARKPGPRVLPLGIDECRVPCDVNPSVARRQGKPGGRPGEYGDTIVNRITPERYAMERPGEAEGRYPANLLHDSSDEVLEAFANTLRGHDDTGTAARFFYTAKASKKERGEGNSHPCVKPLALIRWLVRLVCPPGGTVLDPFGGSGTTGVACQQEGRGAILVEREPQYVEIIRRRLAESASPEPPEPEDFGPLFAEVPA